MTSGESKLSEIKQHQETEPDEDAEYDTVPPLLRPYPPNQGIDPRYLAGSTRDPPIDTRKSLPLHPKALVNRIRLTENTVRHAVTAVYPSPFVKHIFRFCGGWIGRSVGIDIGSDIRKKVCAITRIHDVGT